MDNYWLLAPSVAFGLVAIAAALAWRRERKWRQALYEDYGDLMAENKHLESQLADAKEIIADRDAQIRALNQQTAPIEPVGVPARPKRTRMRKVVEE